MLIEERIKPLTAPASPWSPATVAGLVTDLIRSARPRQWVKNVLVLAAPGAAGVLLEARAVSAAVVAFAAFSLAASGAYLINDVVDVAGDRLHPTKKARPIAAGRVPIPVALVTAAALLAAGLGTAALDGPRLVGVTVVYVGLTLSYSLVLKNEPVIDVATVAAGFVLRAIAGGVATGVRLSDWFVIVASFGSLFMVSGKRNAEQATLADQGAAHRRTLASYNASYLHYLRTLSSAVAILAYCLWAFERSKEGGPGAIYSELSIAPFVLGILRYGLLLEAGGGGAPEEVVLSDRVLQLMGLAWAGLFAVGVYWR
jgi:decaprenyl-phosphate phosphoribosyltransferase